ncbi:MAG: class I SAM-dependent methyltransferase [Candidatus Hodarchaeales archaeon]|jgi:ubiquinone/menaquinone biosynthesis C-methylase UbiE
MTTIDTNELFDLMGNLNSPIIHMGGLEATEKLLELIRVDENSHILVIGCGTGFTACEIAKRYESRVVGIDISEEMIDKARNRARKQKLIDKVEFLAADVFQLPFEDETFDRAIFESVLTILPGEKVKAISEIVRVVRSSGRVGGNEDFILPTTPPEVLKQISDIKSLPSPLPTSQELVTLFENSGLQDVMITEYPAREISSGMAIGDLIKTMGRIGTLSYVIRMFYHYLGNSNFRRYAKMSRMILRNKKTREYFGYALIVGHKSS